ncbi:MAG: hemerythrin domain-containing protein [Thermoanaerobaculia bacterium]|nr:hemerythrin domain-containing protein [Thermoanaerobaculia bacterium]
MDSATTSERLTPEARQRIEREHEALRVLVGRVEEAEDLQELSGLLEELETALDAHFESEEAEDGLHAAIDRTAPHKQNALEELFEEHRAFLTRVQELADEARRCLEGPMKEVVHGARELARELREHEERETELFLDANYTEYGGGD